MGTVAAQHSTYLSKFRQWHGLELRRSGGRSNLCAPTAHSFVRAFLLRWLRNPAIGRKLDRTFWLMVEEILVSAGSLIGRNYFCEISIGKMFMLSSGEQFYLRCSALHSTNQAIETIENLIVPNKYVYSRMAHILRHFGACQFIREAAIEC